MCKIELGTPSFSVEQQAHIEHLANNCIREQRPMYPTYYDSADDPAVLKVRVRILNILVMNYHWAMTVSSRFLYGLYINIYYTCVYSVNFCEQLFVHLIFDCAQRCC